MHSLLGSRRRYELQYKSDNKYSITKDITSNNKDVESLTERQILETCY